jgi:hypothetical protein
MSNPTCINAVYQKRIIKKNEDNEDDEEDEPEKDKKTELDMNVLKEAQRIEWDLNNHGVAFSTDKILYALYRVDVYSQKMESIIERIHAFHDFFTVFNIDRSANVLRWCDFTPKTVPASALATSFHSFDQANLCFSIISSFDIKDLIYTGNRSAAIISGSCDTRLISDIQVHFKQRPATLTFSEDFEKIREAWISTSVSVQVEEPKKEEEKYPEEIEEEERLKKKNEPAEKVSIYKDLPEDISKPVKMHRKPIQDFASLKILQKQIRDKISAQNGEAHKGFKAQIEYNKWTEIPWYDKRRYEQPVEVKHYGLNTTALKEEYEQTQKIKTKLKKDREVAKKEKEQKRKGGRDKGKFDDYN